MVPMKLARTAPMAKIGEVVARGGDQVAGEVDAARDGEEGEEQDDERDVFLGGLRRELQAVAPEGHQQVDHGGHAQHEGDDGLVAVAFEPVAADQRQDGDRQQHQGERDKGPEAQLLPDHEAGALLLHLISRSLADSYTPRARTSSSRAAGPCGLG